MNIQHIIVLLRNVKIVSFKKGELLIKQGSSTKDVFFIRNGLVRSFILNEKGKEITFQLYAEKNFFTNVHGVLFNEVSQFSYEAIEDTKVYTIPYDSLMSITSKNTELLELNRTFFGKKIIQQSFKRVQSFVFHSPEERYKNFVKDHSTLVHRVPDKYIAHVLGVTPVSLSRIRSRITRKK